MLARGKVRDMYAVGDDKLLIIATDRISAFDVILDDPIPGKGQVLKELTDFWLESLRTFCPIIQQVSILRMLWRRMSVTR